MKKLLILEASIPHKPSDDTHVFSFVVNEADSFPEDYLNEEEAEAFYNETYDAVCGSLRDHALKDLFSYRGVDLLWCFKKLLFDYAHFSRLRYETLKRVMAEHQVSQIYLAEKSENPELPFLHQILQASPLKDSFRFYAVKAEEGEIAERRRKREDWKSFYWPSYLTTGKIGSGRVAVFSDLRKSKSIVKLLKPYGCVFVSNAPSPRSLVACIGLKTAFFQFVFKGRQAKEYGRKREEYLARLRGAQIFSNLCFGDLDGQKLLGPRLEELFESMLPLLFFEIDSAHRFFQEARSMKSLLLDEDVLPSKNAFCQVARKYGVASFVECHGSVGHKIGFLPLTADRIFVWGRAQKDKLVQWGCPSERIIVSGCSRYRPYQALEDEEVRTEVAKRLKLDPSKKIVLAAPTPVPSRRFLWEKTMVKANWEMLDALRSVTQETNSQFVIKIHPRDQRLGEYREWVQSQKLGDHGVVVREFDSLLLTKAADLVIVYSSTFAIDAFAMGKPVICACGDSDPWLKEFREFGVFCYVANKAELERVMRKILQGEEGKSPFWKDGRRECLNEGGAAPEETIVRHLLGGILKVRIPTEAQPAGFSR